MYFLVNAYSPKPLDVVTSNLHRCIGHMMWRVWATFCVSHIMYFLVNALCPKLLDAVPSNLHRCIGHTM